MTRRLVAACLLCSLVLLALAGCARIGVRPVSLNDRAGRLDRNALNSDRPSERTLRFLRQRDLEAALAADPEAMLMALDAEARAERDREAVFALAELCYLEAGRNKADQDKAAMFHLSSAVYAYLYLFDAGFRPQLDIYHPYSRQAMEFYNRSLANYILYSRAQGIEYAKGRELPWLMGRVRLAERHSNLAFAAEEVESFHLAYEFEVRGLSPQQVRLGLGVPIAVVRRPPDAATLSVAERYTPAVRQTYAASLLLRLDAAPGKERHGRLVYEADFEVHDPMKTDFLDIAGARVPLEIDLTTPLAFMMQNTPEPSGLEGMLNPAAWEKLTRLYMLQPYDPDKIPVVFVHGLLSSPTTWAPMFNGLMGDPELRARYQFWFFRYPTGNPVIHSAATLRASLDEVRRSFDPAGRNPAFNAMVVVGHSMGGLLTKTLVQDSGDRLWTDFSPKPLDSLTLAPEDRTALQQAFYFTRRPYVARVVFIATPHQGSEMALGTIGDIGRALITLPLTILKPLGAVTAALAQGATPPGSRAGREPKLMVTGVDSLSPKNPTLRTLADLPMAVPHHSVIGNEKKADTPGGTDGVVPYWSSHLDDAQSEKIVHSGHSAQDHPLAIREVRRILLEHLDNRAGQEAAALTP
ncbi:esterase/lipase family protein [Solidesulfovibrio sp.]